MVRINPCKQHKKELVSADKVLLFISFLKLQFQLATVSLWINIYIEVITMSWSAMENTPSVFSVFLSCVYVCVCVWERVCVCVCVCVRGEERQLMQFWKAIEDWFVRVSWCCLGIREKEEDGLARPAQAVKPSDVNRFICTLWKLKIEFSSSF